MTFRTLMRVRVVLRTLCVSGGVLLLAPAAALAVIPETPQVKVRFAERSAVALLGVLNPGKAGEVGTYEFLYKEGSSCEGGSHTTPGISLGAQGEEVYERIEDLTAQSEYTVCLIARNGGEKAQSVPVTIVTGPPEEPQALQASEITASTAELNGILNPGKKGEADTYEFLYKQSASECAIDSAERERGIVQSKAPEPEGVSTGASPETVSAKVSGLLPGAKYTFCLRTLDAAEEGTTGPAETFETAAAAPVVRDVSFSEVASTTATVSAQIGSGGRPSTYRVEYGPSESYGSSTPEASIGAPEGLVGVRQTLTGLRPGTFYHFRFTATNTLGASTSTDLTFTTPDATGATSSTLPDDRVYEDVSLPVDADGEVYHPYTNYEPEQTHQTFTLNPVRAAAAGNAVAYVAEAPPTGGSGSKSAGEGDVFLATRGASGWNPVDITPTVEESEVFQGFSNDLSLSFLAEFGLTLAPGAPSNCDVLYSHSTDSGGYQPIFTATETPGNCGGPRFAGVSADDSSVIFESQARLTPEAIEGTEGGFNLYDSVNGRVYLVNVLPGGAPDANAAFGGQGTESFRTYGNAISEHGTSIVWTDLNTGDLYLRRDPASPDASTALIAEAGQFLGASADGSEVLYVKQGNLYEYDIETDKSAALTHGGATEVQGILGSSSDASYVYFVAAGELAPGALPRLCRAETEREEKKEEQKTPNLGCNLYLYHGGETRFVAELSPNDNALPVGGDWRASLNERTAEVTADGQAAVFVSRRSLTGYENLDGCRGSTSQSRDQLRSCQEVFTYDASTRRLSCSSCDPSGAPPVPFGNQSISGQASLPTPYYNTDNSSSYQLRTISENGGRVFFDSPQPLVPQARRGVEGVYEWEREGEGSCIAQESSAVNGGCVFLLSSALSDEEAVFLDADASGSNVFFTTRAQLVPEDHNELVDLYDARVGGGFPHLATACAGTGCQGVPSTPPVFATPSSVTFNGVGNFSAPTLPLVKPKSKPKGCEKGLVKKRDKCLKKSKPKRKTKKRRAKKKRIRRATKSNHGGKS